MATTTNFTWDDFSGGEFGDTPPHRAGRNQWTGLNCLVYRNGEIGPRPGLNSLSNTGLPSGTVLAAGSVTANTLLHWMIIGTDIWTYDFGTTTWLIQSSGVFGAVVTRPGSIAVSDTETYICNQLDNLYRMDHVTRALTTISSFGTALGSKQAGSPVTTFGQRMYAVGLPNTVFYSSTNDFTTWAATDSFNVGQGENIIHLSWAGEVLYITLADSSVWEYRGIPVAASLRRVETGPRQPSFIEPKHIKVLTNGEVVVGLPGRNYPSFIINGKIRELRNLTLDKKDDTAPDGLVPMPMRRTDDVLFLIGNIVSGLPDYALIRYNGIWSHFLWQASGHIGSLGGSDLFETVLLPDFGATNQPYTFPLGLDRPGFTSDDYGQPGDDSTTPLTGVTFSTGDILTNDGEMFTVEKVTVDFTKFQTGQSETSHFDIDVTMLAHGAEQGETTQSYTAFDEANATATTAGTRDRHTARGVSGGPKRGSGVRITLDNIRACTIRAITVTLVSDEGSLMIQPLS